MSAFGRELPKFNATLSAASCFVRWGDDGNAFPPVATVKYRRFWRQVATNVIAQCRRMNYDGEIWPVHPKRAEMAGVACFPAVDKLPKAPDAAFVGINRYASVRPCVNYRPWAAVAPFVLLPDTKKPVKNPYKTN